MGAGNPLIRSWDEELYSAKTYFIDFSDFYTEEEKINAVKEHYESNELDGLDDLSEEEIDILFVEVILDWDAESFQNDYFFNLDKEWDIWEKPDKDQTYQSELSAAFRGGAIILAENDDCLVLTTDEAEIHHYPIALIPAFKWNDILEDIHYENIDKMDWYDRMGKDFDAMVEKKATALYEKKLKKWHKTYEPFMRYFYSHYGKGLSSRNGSWTSLSLKEIGKDFKFL